MIRVCVRRHEDGLEISATGHAGYAERGRDIVCAGVSALLFGYLSHLVTLAPSAAADEAEGMHNPAGKGDSGDRPGSAIGMPSVAYRVGKGSLWIRTHGMDGADAAAFGAVRAGLYLIEQEHPDCVRLAEAP